MGKNLTVGSPVLGRGLHLTCLAVMLLCGLHLTVTLLYYLDVHVYTGQMVRRVGSFLAKEGFSIAANNTGPNRTAGPSSSESSPAPTQPCPETSPRIGK